MEDPVGPQIFLQIILILSNAFFAMAEIAVISVNDTKLRVQSSEGDKKAITILKITKNPTAFLSTIQVGITLGGFIASAFAARDFSVPLSAFLSKFIDVSPAVLTSISTVAISIMLSFFMLLFGELVPKRIAMQKPEPIARAISMVVYFLMRLFKPIVIVLTFTTNTVLRLFRIDPNKQENDVSEEEILYMVDVADEKGAIGRNEKEMIENIFEFNNMTAADIMIHRTNVEFLQLGSGDDEILEIIMDTGYSRFPVFNEDQDDIVGILMSRDFLINLQSKEKKSLQEIIRTAYFIPESVRTDILFKNMQSNNIHMAIVIDEYGGTSGLVTLEDLLEEIVGNIYDESDNYDEDEITNVDSQTWRISGSTEIETIAEQLNVQIPESDEYDTLAGLIINELSMIPTEGSTPIINAYGLEMKVESIKERRVESVLVKKISDIQLINHGDEKDLLNEP